MSAKPYLIAYNLAACFGWAYIVYLTAVSALNRDAPSVFWDKVGLALKVVQTANALELVHSLLGLVPSPFITALPQVSSRLILLWVYTAAVVDAQQHWSLYLMVGSWSLVEVPRYLFYAVNLVSSAVPGWLFFLRYNLFQILYPTGISGEVLQIIASLTWLRLNCLSAWYASLIGLVLYVPGGPFMFNHMRIQRKRAEQKRAETAKGPKVEEGLVFPMTKKGDRSTTQAGKEAFAASAKAVGETKIAESVLKERDWRFGYGRHVVANVRMSCKSSDAAIKAALGGLEHLHNNFEFIRNGKTMKLSEAMRTITTSFAATHEVVGTGRRQPFDVPYKGQRLTGEALKNQLNKWVSYGTIEPEAGEGIAYAAEHGADLSNQYFVLLGAGSAMGPLHTLLNAGANVIAVDINRPQVWKRLINLAKESSGRMYIPLAKEVAKDASVDAIAEVAGCNLFTQTPEICNWLKTILPGKRLIIGAYAYLDGALHVQVSLAMDAIMQGVCEVRKDTGLAYLCSPTDIFIRPESAYNASKKNLSSAPAWQKLISSLAMGNALVPNTMKPEPTEGGENLHLVDGIVVAQGPNYALAKRIQHWRAMVSRARGHVASSNIAPSTRTASVVSNKSFAAAYEGMHLFKPMEIMYQETSNAVMGALLIHDFLNPKSFSHPNSAHPLALFADGAYHGGVWRTAYKMDSIGVIAALVTYIRWFGTPVLATAVAATAAITYGFKNNALPHQWF